MNYNANTRKVILQQLEKKNTGEFATTLQEFEYIVVNAGEDTDFVKPTDKVLYTPENGDYRFKEKDKTFFVTSIDNIYAKETNAPKN
jgi:hypothetical protein